MSRVTVTHTQADEIIRLRDKENMKWEVIYLMMGLGKSSVHYHYKRRKEGKFYPSELIEFLKDYNTDLLNVREIYRIVTKAGFKLSERCLRSLILDNNIPYHLATSVINKRYTDAKEMVKEENMDPTRAIQIAFKGYSWRFRKTYVERLKCFSETL